MKTKHSVFALVAIASLAFASCGGGGTSSSGVAKKSLFDLILVDPMIFDYATRAIGRSRIAEYSDAAVAALQTVQMEDEVWRQYDEVVNLYDAPPVIIKKLRAVLVSRQDSPRQDSQELSLREKEILVCVAKGMLNKEIADLYNISIYTVITHRKNITRKTGIKTVAGLTVYALLNNLIDANSIE
jgi:DNA-binding CsgD family transcriptional regulator